MKLLDIITSPWLILPEKLVEIQEIYITHLRGEKIDIGAVEASLGRPLANEEKPYEIENGVAKISIEGVIAKRMNMFIRISGGVSSQLISRDFREALKDEEVESILLYIDSPGGDADGTQELAMEIYNARGQKPIVAFSDGMMASAAYYIGAAADKIFISGDNVQIGSIGVVARHVDVSKADEKMGVKRTDIVAGKYKRITSEIEPLTESGRKSMQEAVDHIYEVFVGDVAKFRGLSPEPVKEGKEEIIPWAEGKVFLGKKAITAGLVDGVSTMERLIGTYGTDRIKAVRMIVEDQIRKTRQANKKI
jgi:signal peptide peptidase SppA